MVIFFVLVVNQGNKCLFYGWVCLVVVCCLGFQCVWGFVGDKFVVIDQFDVVVVFCFIYEVGGDYYCYVFINYVINMQLEFVVGKGIDVGGGFIEKQNIGFMYQGVGQCQLLFVVEWQFVGGVVGDIFQVKGIVYLGDFFILCLVVQVIDVGEKVQVLFDVEVVVQ